MEEAHRNHKETTWDWLGALTSVVAGIKARARPVERKYTVTPWSGRSPSGWSA